jgi:ABC-2 type transport system ATP-binding protein
VTGAGIQLRDVSKFYGEVLGVNRVSLDLKPGLTGLVGPNGSGKSTLMHLLTGLLRPTRGSVSVLGIRPDQPELLYREVGYCTQYDSFPSGATGVGFLRYALALRGYDRAETERRSWQALETVGLTEAGRRRIAGYSKGMRQRIKLAQALCHDPPVLVLDEPLNGLDPVARADTIRMFREQADAGRFVIVSTHILHEVDQIADTVVMIHGGAVVAEGSIRGVREEITSQPIQVLVRCDRPRAIAALAFALEDVVEARVVDDGGGLLVRTRSAEGFFDALPGMVLTTGAAVEAVTPADETADAVYDYLIGRSGGSS